jgi:site-specific DNA-methyltransferase (adenine-specific)
MPHTLITGTDGEKYQTYELTAPGITKDGDSGLEWRGFNPSRFGRHWANAKGERDGWDKLGLIHWPKEEGFPRRRDKNPFDPESREVTVGDVWIDIDRLNQTAKERLGYPTQKPEALLERILRASSNEGDVVLDPFCGCGTTVQVAQRLNRRWIGIDITHLAIGLIKKRLSDAFGPEIRSTYDVIGEPTDLAGAESLSKQDDKYQFQSWALGLCGARPAEGIKKGADRGIDGRLYFHDDDSGQSKQIVFSVKAGGVSVPQIRDLVGVLTREKAEIGVFLCFEPPTKPMLKEAAEAGFYRSTDGTTYPKLQILTIQQILDGRQPEYPLHRRDATFKKAPRNRPAVAANLTLSLLPPE